MDVVQFQWKGGVRKVPKIADFLPNYPNVLGVLGVQSYVFTYKRLCLSNKCPKWFFPTPKWFLTGWVRLKNTKSLEPFSFPCWVFSNLYHQQVLAYSSPFSLSVVFAQLSVYPQDCRIAQLYSISPFFRFRILLFCIFRMSPVLS